jgi:hypothetical protein
MAQKKVSKDNTDRRNPILVICKLPRLRKTTPWETGEDKMQATLTAINTKAISQLIR